MAKKKSGWVKASGYLFLLGIIIAIIAGLGKDYLIYYGASISGIEIILGFIIGLLGIAGMGSLDKSDTDIFLLAVVALIAAGSSGAVLASIPWIGTYLSIIVGYIATLVVPAAILVALKAIWEAGSTKF